MNDWDIRKTECSRDEWTVNDAGGTREVELDRECHDGCLHHIFLTRDDLTEMLAAIDEPVSQDP